MSIAKYDSYNKIQIPVFLVDFFRLKDSPRKDYQLGLIGFKMLWNGITNKNKIILSGVVTSSAAGKVSLADVTWAKLASVSD